MTRENVALNAQKRVIATLYPKDVISPTAGEKPISRSTIGHGLEAITTATRSQVIDCDVFLIASANEQYPAKLPTTLCEF
jgi:hypothetical protein